MDFSWLPQLVAEINKVPAVLQVALVGLLYLAVIRITAWNKERKSASDDAPAPTVQSAVEDLEERVMPILGEVKGELRDVKEELTKVADIELIMSGRINDMTKDMIEIKTNVENIARR